MKDYYAILQVARNAEPEVVQAAYRRLTQKYHPDTNNNADSNKRMQEINEAYEVLSIPLKREEYDIELSSTDEDTSYDPLLNDIERSKREQAEKREMEAREQAEFERRKREELEVFISTQKKKSRNLIIIIAGIVRKSRHKKCPDQVD